MSNIEYQKIELHATYELGKDHEIIEYEKETVQKLMTENQIEFSIELEEEDISSDAGRNMGTVYVLNLIVRKDDAEKVLKLLDEAGGLGYYTDLDETYNPNEDAKAEENEELNEAIFDAIIEEKTEELKEKFEHTGNSPIKEYEEKRNIISRFFDFLHKLLNNKKGE